MEWIQDAIGVDSQLPEVDELRSCALTTRLSQLKLSIENLKEIILMLQEEKTKCFSNSEKMDCGEVKAVSVQRSNKIEIISELILLSEQSLTWLTSHEEKMSQCEKQMRHICNCLKIYNGSEIRLFINGNDGDAQTKLKNKFNLLQGEEKNLRNLWGVISSLLKGTLEPKLFVDADDLTQKVYNLRNNFYSLEGRIISCLLTYKEMIRIDESHERMYEPSISVHGAVMAIIIFVVAFVLLFVVLITLMMDDLLSNFVSVYHHHLAPS